MGSKVPEVQRLHFRHHKSFSKCFVGENRQLPHPHKSKTWHLAIVWETSTFYEGLRVFNFFLVSKPER